MSSPNMFSIPHRILEQLGLPIDRLCERAGVARANAWSTDDFFRLWAAAEQELCDRSTGLRFGAEGITRGYAVPSIVALHAPDFRHALVSLSRYKRLTCPELVEVTIDGDEAVVSYRWLQATREVPRLLVDTTMAALKAMAHQGSAGRIAPIRLQLARRATDQALLHQHFACPIVFVATHDAMVFHREALDVPFVSADGTAFARVLESLDERLASGEGFSALVAEVRIAIAQQLSEGRPPGIAAVAHRLRASSRTLQRRLRGCRTSFQQQLDGVRRTTANRLLANTELDPIAIAMLLGFAEPNSFARAFRTWEKTSPLRWRERQASAQP